MAYKQTPQKINLLFQFFYYREDCKMQTLYLEHAKNHNTNMKEKNKKTKKNMNVLVKKAQRSIKFKYLHNNSF